MSAWPHSASLPSFYLNSPSLSHDLQIYALSIRSHTAVLSHHREIVPHPSPTSLLYFYRLFGTKYVRSAVKLERPRVALRCALSRPSSLLALFTYSLTARISDLLAFKSILTEASPPLSFCRQRQFPSYTAMAISFSSKDNDDGESRQRVSESSSSAGLLSFLPRLVVTQLVSVLYLSRHLEMNS